MIEEKLMELLQRKMANLIFLNFDSDSGYEIESDFLETSEDSASITCFTAERDRPICSVTIKLTNVLAGVYMCDITEKGNDGEVTRYLEYISDNEVFEKTITEYKSLCAKMEQVRAKSDEIWKIVPLDHTRYKALDKEYKGLRSQRLEIAEKLKDKLNCPSSISVFMPTYSKDLKWFVGMDADMDFY